jgi:hypothetical protein
LFGYIYRKEEISSVKNYIFDENVTPFGELKNNPFEKNVPVCIFDKPKHVQPDSPEILQ